MGVQRAAWDEGQSPGPPAKPGVFGEQILVRKQNSGPISTSRVGGASRFCRKCSAGYYMQSKVIAVPTVVTEDFTLL